MSTYLNGNEIFEQLQGGRWGANNQPSIYLVTAILEQLPVVRIAGGADRYQFEMSRDLTPLEHWGLLDLLTPDEIQRDGRQFDLWWD